MYSDFSWECVRRNTSYIKEWLRFSSKLYENSKKTYDIESLRNRWGLLKYVNPLIDSPEGVYWTEAVSSRSIRIKIHDEGNISAIKIIGNEDGFHRSYIYYNHNQVCIKIYDNTGYFQVFMDENDFLKINKNKYIYISWDRKNTSSLMGFLSGRMLSSSPDVKGNELLQIFDLYRSGYTHRQIATFIYGERITNAEWESDSWLRARIRYKLKKSVRLINKEFYKYL